MQLRRLRVTWQMTAHFMLGGPPRSVPVPAEPLIEYMMHWPSRSLPGSRPVAGVC